MKLYKEETIKNAKLTAYVWELPEGWTSQGNISLDHLSHVDEHKVFPEKDFYPTCEEAGDAVLSMMRSKIL